MRSVRRLSVVSYGSSGCVSQPATPVAASARSALARLVSWARRGSQVRRSTTALHELDDRLLADIGLTRVSVTYGLGRRELIIPLDEPLYRR